MSKAKNRREAFSKYHAKPTAGKKLKLCLRNPNAYPKGFRSLPIPLELLNLVFGKIAKDKDNVYK